MMTCNNNLISVVEPLSPWRYPTHRETAPIGAETRPRWVLPLIRVADKLSIVEALQERIKLLEAQLEQGVE